jgi:hypothetical protein
MKATSRSTIVYGMISALVAWPATGLLAGLLGWGMAFKAMLWACLSGYAMLLVWWSGKRTAAPLFPLALLLGTVLWSGSNGAFFFMLLCGLVWIRSGICFDRARIRALIAEGLTIAGGAGLVTLLGPGAGVTWALGIWLFFLVQSLYFFIVPASTTGRNRMAPADPFERAYRNALWILDDWCPPKK